MTPALKHLQELCCMPEQISVYRHYNEVSPIKTTYVLRLYPADYDKGLGTSYTLTSHHIAEIEALQAENARLREAISTAMPDLEYAAFNLTDYTECDVVNVIDTTCSEKSLLIAIRDLKQALAAPIEKNTEE